LYAEAETASSELASLELSAQLAAESLRLAMLRYKKVKRTFSKLWTRKIPPPSATLPFRTVPSVIASPSPIFKR